MTAVTVYCGSSPGRRKAYQHAAYSLGEALAASKQQLVYGGGSKGIMGIVSSAVLGAGGDVLGVIPHAMFGEGGEGERVSGDDSPVFFELEKQRRERMEWIVVNSMHERKVEMARRSCGFIGLPGGYGTFEEVLEVTTWTQLGIHAKPVVLANVLGFFDPIQSLIRNAIEDGFIQPMAINLVKFVNGPSDHSLHETFDWGKALLEELNSWKPDPSYSIGFDWTKPREGGEKMQALEST